MVKIRTTAFLQISLIFLGTQVVSIAGQQNVTSVNPLCQIRLERLVGDQCLLPEYQLSCPHICNTTLTTTTPTNIPTTESSSLSDTPSLFNATSSNGEFSTTPELTSLSNLVIMTTDQTSDREYFVATSTNAASTTRAKISGLQSSILASTTEATTTRARASGQQTSISTSTNTATTTRAKSSGLQTSISASTTTATTTRARTSGQSSSISTSTNTAIITRAKSSGLQTSISASTTTATTTRARTSGQPSSISTTLDAGAVTTYGVETSSAKTVTASQTWLNGTTQGESNSNRRQNNEGIPPVFTWYIVGGVAGGIALIVIIIVSAIAIKNRNHRKKLKIAERNRRSHEDSKLNYNDNGHVV